ncbi:hypothetical protein PHYPSEUDO_010358 [Phytophthora pseudosyringae]|uniref:Ankyrin repeat protein n=1 Tax=Phytophthora pseudosyringae TaxID=221518 RepID=A0A8T1WBP4_9STRA|nr:hypothetical protein PHYPSEUDO_010358 [Phytophthora pseudosyringae]
MNACPPVLTTAFVVCRGCLGVHGVESLSHVVSRLDEYLNTFSLHWTVPRACDAGLSRRGLEYLAARDPDWEDGHDAAPLPSDQTKLAQCHVGAALRCAAENGHTAVVEWLYWIVRDERRGVSIIRDAAQLASKAGHAKVAKQLERKLKRPREAKSNTQTKKKSKRRRRRY